MMGSSARQTNAVRQTEREREKHAKQEEEIERRRQTDRHTKYSNLTSAYFLIVSRVSGTALLMNVFMSPIMTLMLFSISMPFFSIDRCISPKRENVSDASGCGSRTPIVEKISPNSLNM